jgi:hypothetical protein
MLFNKRENVTWPAKVNPRINRHAAPPPSSKQRGIRDKRDDSCEMIDGHVAIVPVELRVTRGLAAARFAVNGFPFVTLEAHQCVSFGGIQRLNAPPRFDRRRAARRSNSEYSDPMQITPAFPWKLVSRARG